MKRSSNLCRAPSTVMVNVLVKYLGAVVLNYINTRNQPQKKVGYKGGGVAELLARPPTDPKVRGLNHRSPEYL